MQARGKTKKILIKVYQIQSLVGEAWMHHQNDRNPEGFELAQKALKKAESLCWEITGMYDYFDIESKSDKT